MSAQMQSVDTLYPANSRKCSCKRTGLIPPTAEFIREEGRAQAYCPTHVCKRTWPQLQADGTIKFIPQ
jgi:hypothetical protein